MKKILNLTTLFFTIYLSTFVTKLQADSKINNGYYTFSKTDFSSNITISNKEHSHIETYLKQANELFNDSLYLDSLSIYLSLIELLKEDNSIQKHHELEDYIHLRLAINFIKLEKYSELINLLKTVKISERPYLLSIAYNLMGKPQLALEEINKIAFKDNDLNEELLLEKAKALYGLGEFSEAKKLFETISLSSKQELSHLAFLYLSRIFLSEHAFDECDSLLNHLEKLDQIDSLFEQEIAFLRGKLHYQKGHFEKALPYFETSISKFHPFSVQHECSFFLGKCHLQLAQHLKENSVFHFDKAEEIFVSLTKTTFKEEAFLKLGECYLRKAHILNDSEGYKKAEKLLSQTENFSSKKNQDHALMLRAEASPSYDQREIFYRHLTQENNTYNKYYPKIWYLRGINEFEEGKRLRELGNNNDAHIKFELAAQSLKISSEYFNKTQKKNAAVALKYHAYANFYLDSREGYLSAISILNDLKENQEFLSSLVDPDEILYLKGLVYSHLSKIQEKEKNISFTIDSLNTQITTYPNGSFLEQALYLLAISYFHEEDYEAAEKKFIQLVNTFPYSVNAGEAYYWAAKCAQNLQNHEKAKEYRKTVYEKYPLSPFAAEAFFYLYPYSEYIQGNKSALKHLELFPKYYPESPLILNVYYLLGMNFKRDLKSSEGKCISKQDYHAALDAFTALEKAFNLLNQKNLIAESDRLRYTLIFNRAYLEKALAFLAIAEKSQDSKQHIYMSYAIETLKKNKCSLNNYNFLNLTAFQNLYEENSFWLAFVLHKAQFINEAEEELAQLINFYESSKVTKGHFLSRALIEKGNITLEQKNPLLALTYFQKAEDAAKGKFLNTDQKLDLWIQQSLCYQLLENWDDAHLMLSKIINDNSVSAVRIKAMYLRAELYDLQNRPDLARRQLESTFKKGGEWALKAKNKLECDYGYD